MKIYLYNSLTKQKEEFKPIKKKEVGLYTCGPTVYDQPHLGNLAAYIYWDVLKRFLISQNFTVKHIMNLTDVGHLTSDADEGEDKLQAAGSRVGQTAWDIAKKYIQIFKDHTKELNILAPTEYLRATKTIKEQIDFVKILDKKKYLYRTSDGMYFDTSKVKKYGQLANLDKVKQQEGARVEKNEEKKNPTDFAVWKFSPQGKQRDMEWDSPWGTGFPGWHLECSVMSRMTLGDTFDIHTGGIDHLTVHHPNEMAQSEAVTGKLQARYWLHNAYIKFNHGKMSKSAGTFFTLADLKKKGFLPADFRFLVLQNHYRKSLNFTWQSLEAAHNGLMNIIKEISSYEEPQLDYADLEMEFYEALSDNLNTASGLAILQKIIDSKHPTHSKLATIFKVDEVLGLGLKELREKALSFSPEVKKLLKERIEARKSKDYQSADKLRDKLQKLGIEVQDTELGQKAVKLKL